MIFFIIDYLIDMSKSEDGIFSESFLIKQLNMWVFTCMNIGREDFLRLVSSNYSAICWGIYSGRLLGMRSKHITDY